MQLLFVVTLSALAYATAAPAVGVGETQHPVLADIANLLNPTDTCSKCGSMVDAAKADFRSKYTDASDPNRLTHFKTVWISDLVNTCTSKLDDVTCTHCEECVLNVATADQVDKYLDTPSSKICEAFTGVTCTSSRKVRVGRAVNLWYSVGAFCGRW